MAKKEMLELIYDEVIGIKHEMKDLKADVQDLKADVQDLKADVQDLKADVQVLKDDVCELKKKTDTLDDRMSNVEREVRSINVVLENEIRVNIKRVAEGHLDLARNVMNLVKPSNEVEMLSIHVRMLDADVKRLKEVVL